ncbi:unnamed protein product [Somion occarium]|uniref:Uncharacterized protein n=1 Tax=Somion occarium TaxID=3059160 RepID=A0ABP1EBJ7_9APHY
MIVIYYPSRKHETSRRGRTPPRSPRVLVKERSRKHSSDSRNQVTGSSPKNPFRRSSRSLTREPKSPRPLSTMNRQEHASSFNRPDGYYLDRNHGRRSSISTSYHPQPPAPHFEAPMRNVRRRSSSCVDIVPPLVSCLKKRDSFDPNSNTRGRSLPGNHRVRFNPFAQLVTISPAPTVASWTSRDDQGSSPWASSSRSTAPQGGQPSQRGQEMRESWYPDERARQKGSGYRDSHPRRSHRSERRYDNRW